MEKDWVGPSYDLLKRNCCSFCNEFCVNLGVGPLPGWVNGLAGTGAQIYDITTNAHGIAQESLKLPANVRPSCRDSKAPSRQTARASITPSHS